MENTRTKDMVPEPVFISFPDYMELSEKDTMLAVTSLAQLCARKGYTPVNLRITDKTPPDIRRIMHPDDSRMAMETMKACREVWHIGIAPAENSIVYDAIHTMEKTSRSIPVRCINPGNIAGFPQTGSGQDIPESKMTVGQMAGRMACLMDLPKDMLPHIEKAILPYAMHDNEGNPCFLRYAYDHGYAQTEDILCRGIMEGTEQWIPGYLIGDMPPGALLSYREFQEKRQDTDRHGGFTSANALLDRILKGLDLPLDMKGPARDFIGKKIQQHMDSPSGTDDSFIDDMCGILYDGEWIPESCIYGCMCHKAGIMPSANDYVINGCKRIIRHMAHIQKNERISYGRFKEAWKQVGKENLHYDIFTVSLMDGKGLSVEDMHTIQTLGDYIRDDTASGDRRRELAAYEEALSVFCQMEEADSPMGLLSRIVDILDKHMETENMKKHGPVWKENGYWYVKNPGQSGYDIAIGDYGNGAEHIERIDELMKFPDDMAAAIQAEKDGIPIIHDLEFPPGHEAAYVDTPENRKLLEKIGKPKGAKGHA